MQGTIQQNSVQPGVEFSTEGSLNVAGETETASLVIDGKVIPRGVEQIVAGNTAYHPHGKPYPPGFRNRRRNIRLEVVERWVRGIDDMRVAKGAVHRADCHRMQRGAIMACKTFGGQAIVVYHERMMGHILGMGHGRGKHRR
jgi:hypothetical protein